MESVDTATNELTKLAKAFDDLVNNIKNLIGPLAEFMALALSQNTVATAGVGLLAGGSVISALTPKVTPIDALGMQAGARGGMQGMLSEKGMKEFGALDSPKSIARFEQAMTRKKSSFLNYSTFVKHEGQRMASILKVQEHQRELQSAGMFKRMRLNWKITMQMMVAEHGVAMARIKMAGRMLLKGISFLGYAGLFISVTAMAVQFFKTSDKAATASRKAQQEFGNLFEKNAEDLAKMVDGLKTYDSLLTNALQSAKSLSNIDYSQAQAAFQDGLGSNSVGGVSGRNQFTSHIMQVLAGFGIGKGIRKDTLSDDQVTGMEGIVSTLNSQMKLLVAGGAAHSEMAGIARGIQSVIDVFAVGEGTPKDLEDFMGFLEDLSDGTIASNAMNNLAQTTQIMTSSASDFSKALNSFRTPRTQLTRLTSNIKSVGEALSGVGDAFSEGNIKMKIGKDGKGSLFDKATKDMLATFLTDDQLGEMKKDEGNLNFLDS